MGDLKRVLRKVDRIARRGRNFGFRLIIIKRLAKLHEDLLTADAVADSGNRETTSRHPPR